MRKDVSRKSKSIQSGENPSLDHIEAHALKLSEYLADKSKIKKTVFLPNWFQRSDFHHYPTYGTSEWYLKLQALHTFSRDLESGKVVNDFRTFSAVDVRLNDDQIIELAFAAMASAPVSKGMVNELHKSIIDHPLRKLQFTGVQSINDFHRYGIAQTVDTTKPRKCTRETRSNIQGLGAEEKPFFINVIGTAESPGGAFYARYSGIIAVDMWLPNELLIANFKRWLNAARNLTEQSYVPKLFATSDYARWVDDAYVPQMLLNLWSAFRGIEISQPVLVEALFPNRRDVTIDQFRKTKLPNFLNWCRYETLDALQAQVELEVLSEIAAKES